MFAHCLWDSTLKTWQLRLKANNAGTGRDNKHSLLTVYCPARVDARPHIQGPKHAQTPASRVGSADAPEMWKLLRRNLSCFRSHLRVVSPRIICCLPHSPWQPLPPHTFRSRTAETVLSNTGRQSVQLRNSATEVADVTPLPVAPFKINARELLQDFAALSNIFIIMSWIWDTSKGLSRSF